MNNAKISLMDELNIITRSSLISDVKESLDEMPLDFDKRYLAKFGVKFEQEFNQLLTGTTHHDWQDELATRYALIELRDKVLAIK